MITVCVDQNTLETDCCPLYHRDMALESARGRLVVTAGLFRRPRKVGLFERWLWKAHHLLQQGLSWANKDLQSLLTHKALTPKLPEFKTIQCWNFYGALFLLWLSCWWEGGRCTVPHCLCLLHAGWRSGDQEDLYTHDLNLPAENDANTG